MGTAAIVYTSIDAYFQTDPLDTVAIFLDCAGMHDQAREIDTLNGN